MVLRRILTSVTAVFIVYSFILASSGRSLVTPEAPLGIISFQLAFSESRAQDVLNSWSAIATQRDALHNLLLDFPYIVIYGWLLTLLCTRVSRVDPSKSASASKFAQMAWLAAGFDGLENLALLDELFIGASQPAAMFAGVSATIKFALILLIIGFLVSAELRRRVDI